MPNRIEPIYPQRILGPFVSVFNWLCLKKETLKLVDSLAPVINWPPFILSPELWREVWSLSKFPLTTIVCVLVSGGRRISDVMNRMPFSGHNNASLLLKTNRHAFGRQSNMLLLRNGMICLLKFKRCQVFLCRPALFVADFTSKMTNPL